jgi:ribosomal protein L44E
MAVKVMLAPAIAMREAALSPPSRRAGGEERPKRRRSSVFDSDGNEVFITIVCMKCHKTRPLSQFGLRKMADGAIRNQPWCKTCRSGTASDVPRRKKAVDAAASAEATSAVASPAPPEQPLDAGLMAAQIVAALHGGRR